MRHPIPPFTKFIKNLLTTSSVISKMCWISPTPLPTIVTKIPLKFLWSGSRAGCLPKFNGDFVVNFYMKMRWVVWRTERRMNAANHYSNSAVMRRRHVVVITGRSTTVCRTWITYVRSLRALNKAEQQQQPCDVTVSLDHVMTSRHAQPTSCIRLEWTGCHH